MVLNWNDDKIASSSDESYDSDKIDSDIEAELYSIIHHQQETYQLNSDKEKSFKSSSVKNSTIQLKEDIISFDNFVSDRISDCNLYKNFESQNNSLSNQECYQNCNSLKRKSDSFTEGSDGAQKSTTFSISQNKQNEKSKRKKSKQNISATSQINSDASATNELHTSDSDSDIIFVEPNDNEKLFETNLSLQTVTLTSDSEDSIPPFQSTSYSFQNYRSATHTNITSSGNSKELWFVNNEDLARFKRNSGRYHESTFTQCSICTQRGHTARFCTYTKFVRCFLCGCKHNPWKCKKRTCFRCYGKCHDVRYCRKNLGTCANCQMTGHPHKACPDIWRKYHLTTSKKFITSQRLHQDRPMYCYNCGLEGHFGAVCNERRMDNFSSVTWPSLLDYDIPTKSSIQENEFQKPMSSFMERCNKEQREKILLRRKRRKERKRAEKQQNKPAYSKEIDFPRTPKVQLSNSPDFNLKEHANENSSPQMRLSRKAMQNKRRTEMRKMLKKVKQYSKHVN